MFTVNYGIPFSNVRAISQNNNSELEYFQLIEIKNRKIITKIQL